MSIPMFLGDTFRGALTLRFDHGRRLTPEEAELLQTFSNQAVLAM
jgi:GAF domain-containing protein